MAWQGDGTAVPQYIASYADRVVIRDAPVQAVDCPVSTVPLKFG
jgi:hypothetical protein